MFPLRPHHSFILLAALALAACGGAAPRLIGAYPQAGGNSPPPITVYPPAPANLYIAYNASVELEVQDARYAVYRIRNEAENLGGYLLTSRTWMQGGDEYAEATVAVPVSSFETMRARLRWIGDVRSESVSGELRDVGPGVYGGAESYSNITVSLRPASANGWKKIGGFFTGAFRVALAATPPLLMLIGFLTVARAAIGWIRRRRKVQ
ncbi:MAG: DUF4349 domain-containing protein [Chloroflexi bacterium]|nr:DUF4349 domain-containing protein [Chloroflexota bacterium]